MDSGPSGTFDLQDLKRQPLRSGPAEKYFTRQARQWSGNL